MSRTEEMTAGIKMKGLNVYNFKYADNTTFVSQKYRQQFMIKIKVKNPD